VRIVAAEILHVAEDVSLHVLRHRTAEIRAQPEVSYGAPERIERVHGKTLQHDDAAAVEELASHIAQDVGKVAQREVAAVHVFGRDAFAS
jgi:hypothetical protein